MKLSTQILLAFSVIIILSLADSYTNYMLSQQVERNSQFLSRSETIIRNSNRTHKTIIDMQSSFRGFLLTGDKAFLDAYYNGIDKVPNFLSEIRANINGDTIKLPILDSITNMHSKWVDYSSEVIRKRQSDLYAYELLFNTQVRGLVGKKLNDEISKKFGRFDRLEYATRRHHRQTLQESISSTHTRSLIFLTLTVIVGVISTVYIVMLITKRIASMVKMAESISSGQFTVVHDTKNDELTGLSRSLNIMSSKLNRNIRELENRNAELNKFAYVVSHDLKAPIRGIHNVIKWIEEDLVHELSPQMMKYLTIIPQRTQRMEALINGLLDYARISHKTPAENVDVNSLVHDVADSIVPRTFKLEIDNLPQLYTERLKLEQVFTNLISNAVKYTHNNDGHIKITCKEMPRYYEFSIKDNGIGIEPEYHEKIFEIFQTLREKNEKESTGVGLAIVKKIMDERQETIIVRSGSGEGAEFIFTWKKQ